MSDKIIIYCDGACSGNHSAKNSGGWGAVLKFKDTVREIYGGEKNTSNQRMELTACIKALEQLKTSTYPVEIYSDSAYVVNCFKQGWFRNWEKNGWINSKKDDVANKDLWEHLLKLYRKYKVTFKKVAGHSGIALNERADQLARKGAQGFV